MFRVQGAKVPRQMPSKGGQGRRFLAIMTKSALGMNCGQGRLRRGPPLLEVISTAILAITITAGLMRPHRPPVTGRSEVITIIFTTAALMPQAVCAAITIDGSSSEAKPAISLLAV